MTAHKTQANLALFIGETYCEIEVRDLNNSSIFSKQIFLPQVSLKNALISLSSELAASNTEVTSIYTVCRYLERLKTFRLGGSVIQVTHKGLENNYTMENTSRFSLAASSLIISIDSKAEIDELVHVLNTEFERTRKVNPEANKVVINLDCTIISENKIKLIKEYFQEKKFKIFSASDPENLNTIRRILLNAGTEGTKEELFKEIHDPFPDAHIHFWINKAFTTEIENCELYFSSEDFLGHCHFKNDVKKIIYLDTENWMVLQKNIQSYWDSPWGKISRPHFENTKLALHPLTEIMIDENSFLQFSKQPMASEPGPMAAGRGVKSLILDVFFSDLKKQVSLAKLFPSLLSPNVESKIQSQFKVLEHGQKSESKTLKHNDIKEFIQELIKFDINRLGCTPENSVCIGNMSFLATADHSFSWTDAIFSQIKPQENA